MVYRGISVCIYMPIYVCRALTACAHLCMFYMCMHSIVYPRLYMRIMARRALSLSVLLCRVSVRSADRFVYIGAYIDMPDLGTVLSLCLPMYSPVWRCPPCCCSPSREAAREVYRSVSRGRPLALFTDLPICNVMPPVYVDRYA